MIVNNYGDHLAYTLEGQEIIFSIGNTVLEKMKQKEIITGTTVVMNGQKRLLYPTENLQTLEFMIEKMSSAEASYVLNSIMSLVLMLEENDFLCKEAMDINTNRMYYDATSGSIRCVVFPINKEYGIQGEDDWAAKFQQLTSRLRELQPELATPSQLESPKTSSLVLSSTDGRVYFEFTEGELILGSSLSGINGTIQLSTSISRRHCKIYKYGDRYVVQDLKSTNGTRINGFSLSPEQPYYLTSGDRLQLADVELMVKIEG